MPKTHPARGARVVAVCVTGRPCAQLRQNRLREELLALVAREIRRRRWRDLDAVLLPAGYFRSDEWYGPLDASERARRLDDEDFASTCRTAASRLHGPSPGCLVVVGVDSRNPNWGFRGDQLLVAFGPLGVAGLARKIFPSDGDTHGWGRAPYLLFERDAADPGRVVALPYGRNGLLSVCYDAFLLAELKLGPTGKRRTMRYVSDESDRWRPFGRKARNAYLSGFDRLLFRSQPNVQFVAIHGFERPGRELRWQRHGIAGASAALGGALTVGAAHFAHGLPADPFNHSLASWRVGARHLTLGPHRRAETLRPMAGFHVSLAGGAIAALVRLFAVD